MLNLIGFGFIWLMEIVHYKSIKEIPQNEWEKYGLDFALSDGVYDYAIYNEKYSDNAKKILYKFI